MRLWRYLAVVWVLMALIAAGYVTDRFIRSNPVKTDIMALLPPTERNPNAEAAVEVLTKQLGNRAVFLIGHQEMENGKRLARQFATALRTSGAFTRVIDSIVNVDANAIIDSYKPYRAYLLTPSDRDILSAKSPDLDSILMRQMHQPFRVGMPTNAAEDPFGFLQRWLSSLPLANTRLMIDDGLLTVRDGSMNYVLVIAEPEGSAFDSNVQSRVVPAVRAAEDVLKSTTDAVLLRTGAIFYADAARRSAEKEVDLIGGGSLVGILLLMWLLFRSVRPLLLGMMTVAIGVACGMAAVLALNGHVHLITIVFGASLIGEAVDYSIQYFAAHLADGPNWEPRRGLKRILPGLAIALLTSLVGYGTLSLTPFPAISQIALFAFVGLATAWISVVLLLPLFVKQAARHNVEHSMRVPQRILTWWRERVTPRTAICICTSVVVLSAPGWMQLTANDDVRQLVTRPAHLVEQETVIRRLVAGEASGRFFLVEGSNDEEALKRDEALAARLRSQIGQHIAGFSAVSSFVPSYALQHTNRSVIERVLPITKAKALFEEYGFREETTTLWAGALAASNAISLEEWRNSKISLPVRHQVLSNVPMGTALIVTLNGDDGSPILSEIAAGLPGVTLVDKSASVSALFGEYRNLAGWWIPAAMFIIFAILAWRYGLQQGVAVIIPTLLAMFITMGLHGYSSAPITLFSMMGLLLVLGVGVNYAIFLIEAGDRAPAPFAGVLLSAATTILSFGLLCISSMPALHQFGFVLLAGVSFSVLLAPIALTLGKGTK